MILKIHPKKNRTNIFAAQPFMLLLSGINSNPKTIVLPNEQFIVDLVIFTRYSYYLGRIIRLLF